MRSRLPVLVFVLITSASAMTACGPVAAQSAGTRTETIVQVREPEGGLLPAPTTTSEPSPTAEEPAAVPSPGPTDAVAAPLTSEALKDAECPGIYK